MNYDERLDRLEKLNGQAVELLKTLLEIESIQSGSLKRHEEMFTRIETNLAEATDKLNLLIAREMKREGGPEAAA
jgi:hypothetical protein